MKDKARSRTYYSLAREKLMENYPKIFSFMLILALISLTGLAAFLISDILSFGSDSAHKGALVGIDLQDRGKSILAILNGNDEKTNLMAANNSENAKGILTGTENLSAQVESSNSSRTGTSFSQSQVSGSATADGTTSSSSSDKQTKKRKVNSSSRKNDFIASSADSSKSAKESDDQLNQTQVNQTQQIQTMINQSQKNQSRINDSQIIRLQANDSQIIQLQANDSQIIQLQANDSQIIQLQANDSQINTSQASEPKMEISSSSNISGDLLTAEPANIETKNSVNLSSQNNISVSSDSILVDSSASLAAEDQAQKDHADSDAATADSGLNQAKDASKSPEVRLEFKTDSATEPKSENVQNPEEMSSGAASSSDVPSDLQVAESIQAEEINAVAESPKSSTIQFNPEPPKKEGNSGKTSRITTPSSRAQKKLQIAKTQQMTDRNKHSTNLKKKSTLSRANPRSKKPSG